MLTTDEDKLQEGLENVQKVLENHYVDPDQAENIKSDIKQKGGTYKIIDRISVKLNPSQDKYWANLFNSNIKLYRNYLLTMLPVK